MSGKATGPSQFSSPKPIFLPPSFPQPTRTQLFDQQPATCTYQHIRGFVEHQPGRIALPLPHKLVPRLLVRDKQPAVHPRRLAGAQQRRHVGAIECEHSGPFPHPERRRVVFATVSLGRRHQVVIGGCVAEQGTSELFGVGQFVDALFLRFVGALTVFLFIDDHRSFDSFGGADGLDTPSH